MILTQGMRSKAYLQNMIQNKLLPNHIILMTSTNHTECWDSSNRNNPEWTMYFNAYESIVQTLTASKIPYEEINTNDCNNQRIIESLKARNENYVIFTGGGILKKEILSINKKFIHIHPGYIPDYRGSTCFYYSIINDGNCGATAFFMNEGIDCGDIIKKKKFKMPTILDIDNIFDPHMRSELLIEILKDYVNQGEFHVKPQNHDKGETYFIIHPILKHLAILESEKEGIKNRHFITQNSYLHNHQ